MIPVSSVWEEEMMTRQISKKKWILGGLLTAAVLAGGIGYAGYAGATQKETTVYKETTVKKGDLTVGVTESGSVEVGTISQDLSDLSDILSGSSTGSTSAAGGTLSAGGTGAAAGSGASSSASSGQSSSQSGTLEVEEVLVSVGQSVQEGDALLKITEDSIAEYRQTLEDDLTDAQLSLKEAQLNEKSQKVSAQGTYNSNVASGSTAQSEYDTTIATLQAAVDEAQAAVDSSAAKIADYQTRQAAGEDVSASLAEEQANYNTLVSRLASVKNEQTTKTVEAKQKYQEAALKADNASSLYEIDMSSVESSLSDAQDTYDDAKEALDTFNDLIGDGTIRSEYAGTIASVGYSEGDSLSASTDVVTFADRSQVTMTVAVSQEDISGIATGSQAQIALTAYDDKTYEGEVESVDTSASSGTSTVSYNVTVKFTGDTSDVYQDMTGNVTFVSAQAKDVCYVSRKAVTTENGTSVVKVKREDGSIEEVTVETGINDGINIEIDSGLSEGDTALIESQVAQE